MNDLIKQQLDKVKWVVLPPYDESTTELTIPRIGAKQELLEGHIYLISIADYILHPSDTFSLAVNWNKGIVPQSKTIRCQLLQKAGNMYKFGAIGFDEVANADKDDIYPELWLPKDGITVIRILE